VGETMREELKTTVYNSRNLSMRPYSNRHHLFILILLFIVSCKANGQATNWNAPQQQLADKISAVVGPGAVSIEVTNRSSLSRSDVDQIRTGMLQKLYLLGLRSVNADSAAATVQISLSENLRDNVWVANILQSRNEPSVVMVSFPRTEYADLRQTAPAITLHRTLLWSQPEPILDAALISGSPQHLIILDANTVSVYQMQGGHWQMEQALSINHLQPWPRDLRGRLVLRKDHLLDAYLPGTICNSASGAPVALSCRRSDDPWPIGFPEMPMNAFFAASRNFFTGALAPGIGKQTSVPAFFSSAPLPRDRYTLWLFTATDGQLHLLDGFTDQNVATDWGSEIASIHSGCGTGWQVLANSKADMGNDSIRIFEVPDREPLQTGQPMEFRGNITALWTQGDKNSAIAVVHDSDKGNYEAYQLTLACDQ
jgi:hypothetical protein